MVRIIDLPALLRDVEGALQERLARSSPTPGAVWLESDLAGSAGIEWDGNNAAVMKEPGRGCLRLRVPQSRLSSLITGYRTVQEVLEQAGLAGSVTPDGLALLEALFPQGYAHIWELDTA